MSFKSGFVALTGRPNVGKSTLLNQIINKKISIVSNKAQTTRRQIQGIYHGDGFQIVFVDNPGIAKPVTELGKALNKVAYSTFNDVDLTCFVVDANSGYGRGDRFIADKLDPEKTICVLNKIDGLKPERILQQLDELSQLNFLSYFPVSAWDGTGVSELVEYIVSRLEAGPEWFESDQISNQDEPTLVAELVREQLLRKLDQELPHSISTRVVEWNWPYIKVEIFVERNSQVGIVIGKNGALLKQVGTSVRKQLKPGAYLDLVVSVKKNWQSNANLIEELGY